MNQPEFDTESTSEDEFEVEAEVNDDPSTVLDRLKEFAYYLVENIESNLNLCLNLLEERDLPSQPNSIHTTVISGTLSAIPKIGSVIGKAVSKGESFILERIDKNNSKILADLVYYYSDHKEDVRRILIQSAIDLFYSFECQFFKLTCKEGQKRAMQKLAKDASDRILSYLLETEQKKDVTRDEITKGVLFGKSRRSKAGLRGGRTVVNNEVAWKTNKLYTKTGIVIIEEEAFYKNKETHTEKYGHRRPLPWETPEYIKDNWEEEPGFQLHHYFLTNKEDLVKTIRDYVMTKTPFEEAKLERENYHKDSAGDRQEKHEEILLTFHETFKEVLDDLEGHYRTIVDNHNENKEMLKEYAAKQDEEKVLHVEINRKLQDIHNDINETKILIEVNKTVQKDIADIKSENEKLAETVAVVENIKEVVRGETLQNMQSNLGELMRETLRRNDPGPRIRKEVERNLKKIKKLF